MSKAEGFPSQYGRGTQLMRSETVGKEQEHANVRVSEREYQTLAWEQSSLADGSLIKQVGRRNTQRPAFTADPGISIS